MILIDRLVITNRTVTELRQDGGVAVAAEDPSRDSIQGTESHVGPAPHSPREAAKYLRNHHVEESLFHTTRTSLLLRWDMPA
jgi:hypothetical protein